MSFFVTHMYTFYAKYGNNEKNVGCKINEMNICDHVFNQPKRNNIPIAECVLIYTVNTFDVNIIRHIVYLQLILSQKCKLLINKTFLLNEKQKLARDIFSFTFGGSIFLFESIRFFINRRSLVGI